MLKYFCEPTYYKLDTPKTLLKAHELALESLEIKKSLDHGLTKIWVTCNILAKVSDKQGNFNDAKNYRRLARKTRIEFPGTRYELKQYSKLIITIAKAVNDPIMQSMLMPQLEVLIQRWPYLIPAIYEIFSGERTKEILLEPLGWEEAPIITAILEGIERPESLEWFEQDSTD